ncbi:MAG: hypothetical protein ABSH28_09790 [Acidobacteriota bacterium]|jgi:hypothetical protein
MAVPSFLDCAFRFTEIQITDVASIITTLRDELVTQPAAANKWTEPVSGTFKSPARSDGVFITFATARISATRIAYVVRDHNGLLVNNNSADTRQDIGTGATYVRIYSSPFYVIVDSANPTQNECWGTGIMDRAPEPLADPRPCYWSSSGPRNTTGDIFNNNWFYISTLAVGGTSYSVDTSGILTNTVNQTYSDMFTIEGTMLFVPLEFISGIWLLGRMFNVLRTDMSQQSQAQFTVPLDDNVTGTFRILGWGYAYQNRLCCRVA